MSIAHRLTSYGIAFALAGLVAASPLVTAAQVKLDIPAPVGFVNDFAGFLRSETVAALETKLQVFRDETGHEIVVAIADSLQETTIEDLAVRWFEEWKIGTAKADNGILLLIVPPERVLRIEVGYGLEPVVPDSIARQVGDNIIAPKFREDDPDGGVIAGVDALVSLAKGEEVAVGVANPNANMESQLGLVMFVIMIFVFAWMIYDRIAMIKGVQKTLRSKGARGTFVGLFSLIGGFIAALAGFLPALAWAGIFAATIGALIFYLTKNAGTPGSGGSSGGWHSSGGGWGDGGFGGFGGGSSGGGGSTSRW